MRPRRHRRGRGRHARHPGARDLRRQSGAEARLSATVPLADLHAQYLSIKGDIDAAIAAVIRDSSFIRGPHVERFEREFAAAIGAPHCVSCANGTDALYIAMHALGVKPGDEVITTAHSWIATAETVTQAGGSVVFCDTDSATFTIDAARVESLVTPRTVGIIPVHLYGQPADMGAIQAIAARHKLWVIEDCAQAHLASFGGKAAGTFGDAATFSFYPSKNLGAMGDAGAILSNDAALARKMAMFARHGGLEKNDHAIEGINSRMDGLQAAVLSVKLTRLSRWTEQRQALAAVYDRELSRIPGVRIPPVGANRTHVYHLYTIRHPHRDALARHLRELGIATAINYPKALPFVPAYARLAHVPEHFPNAYADQLSILSLPLYPEMTPGQQLAVIEAIASFRD
ncbi:MAG: DegT/DnrJ/EryC1/StrS family aminotransferase [Usitatibacter sp.]